MGWKEANEKLKAAMEADGKRPKTIQGFEETLNRLMEMFPLSKGPVDITDRMAADFKKKYANGTFTRKPKKEGEKVPLYARKLKSLDSRIRTLKAIFGWFEWLQLVNNNPFAEVEKPELDKHEVKYVRKAAFTRAAERDIHPKRAAVAFDVTPETMLKYYTATEKKRTADEVLTDLAAALLPRKEAK